MLIALLAVATAATAVPAPRTSRAEENLPGLVAAERGFAAQAQAEGVRPAFLAHLAAEAWLFRPQPVHAKEWFDAHPARPGKLEWGPEYAEIAASGDFGYTMGPWRATVPSDKGEQKAFGHFFSVWKRDADGNWKNVVDHGYAHAEVPLDAMLSMRAPGAGIAADVAVAERERRREALFGRDDALNGNDAAAAMRELDTRGDVRHFRDGALPAMRLGSEATVVATGLKRFAAEIASSGDLAYTLGARTDAKADAQGEYVRMWRYERDGWHLVVDLLTPPK
jgi:ketosteroid isomerase-like protein